MAQITSALKKRTVFRHGRGRGFGNGGRHGRGDLAIHIFFLFWIVIIATFADCE
jgi:hypothetical protein